MRTPLPHFAYHPDPIGTGSVVSSDALCVVCGRERGYVYNGSPFAEQELERCICPWCLADRTASARFHATFNDPDGDDWDSVPDQIRDEIMCRTPGFAGWQHERWFAHCGDAMVFVGPVGFRELVAIGPRAVAAVSEELRSEGWGDDEIPAYLRSLKRDGEPTAYVFRCRRCESWRGYSDFT